MRTGPHQVGEGTACPWGESTSKNLYIHPIAQQGAWTYSYIVGLERDCGALGPGLYRILDMIFRELLFSTHSGK
jgi:hypothetical protein